MSTCVTCGELIVIKRPRDHRKTYCTMKCYYASQRRTKRDGLSAERHQDGTYTVYALSEDGHTYRYVGATTYVDIERRRREHVNGRRQLRNACGAWIRAVIDGGGCVQITTLEVVRSADHDHVHEHLWINRLARHGFDLLNAQSGGTRNFTQPSWNKGTKTGPRDAETRRKLSLAATRQWDEGRAHSPRKESA